MNQAECVICGSAGSDRAHLRSRATGAGWDEDEWIYLCRTHHSAQHNIGWYKMAEKYPLVKRALQDRNWKFVEIFGVQKLKKLSKEEVISGEGKTET